MPRRKRKKPQRSSASKGNYTTESSSSDQQKSPAFPNKEKIQQNKKPKVLLSNTISEALSCLDSNNSSQLNNYDQNNMSQMINPSFQYTSTPAHPSMPVSYQPFQPIPQYQQPPTPPPCNPISPGIERLLLKMNNRLKGLETKLSKLDIIEKRMNNMDTKFKTVDLELTSCKDRISALEQSAQFLSNIHDEHKTLKTRLDTLTKTIEATKTDSKGVKERLVDVEKESLKKNLLFFAIKENPVTTEMETNENEVDAAAGGDVVSKTNQENAVDKKSENCVDLVLDLCENVLGIENAKTIIKIENAYRLGKKINVEKPRPIVVRFSEFSDREMIRNMSKRLKGTNYGISPHFPPEVLEKRKKLLPIMFEKRKAKQKAYLVGDKLFVNGKLWEG